MCERPRVLLLGLLFDAVDPDTTPPFSPACATLLPVSGCFDAVEVVAADSLPSASSPFAADVDLGGLERELSLNLLDALPLQLQPVLALPVLRALLAVAVVKNPLGKGGRCRSPIKRCI